MSQARILRIVVASPSDVQSERNRLPQVIDELNRGIAAERGWRLELSRWETDTYPGFHPAGPQGLVDPILRIADCDLLVGIFWKRFGTPTTDTQSGTEHEFKLAYQAWKTTSSPQIFVYFNQTPATPKSKAELEQWAQVLQFREQFPKEGLWWDYQGTAQFERLVRNHLTNYLRHLPGPDSQSTSTAEKQPTRSSEQLLSDYRDHLQSEVSTVRLLGEPEARSLTEVFVQLTIGADDERPPQRAEFLGLMDAEMRRRRAPLIYEYKIDRDEDDQADQPRRQIRPDELLHGHTQAVITGAPGGGKSTLLRYLTTRALADSKCFPVFLELKRLHAEAIVQAQGRLEELLFDQAIAEPLRLAAAERERFRKYFIERLEAGEAIILLDGLDEVSGTSFAAALRQLVVEFMRSVYGRHERNTLLISTRPYALQARFEALRQMEIAPLDAHQVAAFMRHYYGANTPLQALRRELARRHEWRELLRVPALLGFLVRLWREQGAVIGNPLELYRRVTRLLVTELDREKSLEREFRIEDPGGSLKLDFLKHLAYTRLFDEKRKREEERLVFENDLLVKEARRFCRAECPTVNPHWLATDVKATPLLREIGADLYAFAHLTIQEYLAALVLSEREDGERAFCRAYFDPMLAEMEVLPMALGLADEPNDLSHALERLPESLTKANFRLRARSLAYTPELNQQHLTKLVDDLVKLITESQEHSYLEVMLRSFSAASNEALRLITDRLVPLLRADERTRKLAGMVLGQLGGERAIAELTALLQDETIDKYARSNAARTLGNIGGEQTEEALLTALKDPQRAVHGGAVYALGWLGSERAAAALTEMLKEEDNGDHFGVASALSRIGGERAVPGLLLALQSEDLTMHHRAAQTLEKIGSEQVISGLIDLLRHESSFARFHAARTLAQIGNEQALTALHTALRDNAAPIRFTAAAGLGESGGAQVATALIVALKDENQTVRGHAAISLGKIGDETAVPVLLEALSDGDREVRVNAAEALGLIGGQQAVTGLLDRLSGIDEALLMRASQALAQTGGERILAALQHAAQNESDKVRGEAIIILGQIGDEQTLATLLAALTDEDGTVRANAAWSLKELGAKQVATALLEALKDEFDSVRHLAAEALRRLGDHRAVAPLIGMLGSWSSSDQSAAAQALDQFDGQTLGQGLLAALADEDSFVRQKAASFIGYYAPVDQVRKELLRLADHDPVAEVKTEAHAALEKLGYNLPLPLHNI